MGKQGEPTRHQLTCA